MNGNPTMATIATITLAPRLIALAAGLLLAAPVFAADADKGKSTFINHGCWQCHGTVGQGGAAGPRLAPDPKPWEFYASFIRHSAGPMPPYTETVLSNNDLADIHAYLKSLPKTADYKSIPLLNN
jgi:ubiquinol-cytochrome c reductase cytochrome c subunit